MTKPRFSCKMTKRQKMVGNGVFLDEYETLYEIAAIVNGNRIDLGYVEGLIERNRALAIARKRYANVKRIQSRANYLDRFMVAKNQRSSNVILSRV